MIAASARTSGTSAPVWSSLNRGCRASADRRAWAVRPRVTDVVRRVRVVVVSRVVVVRFFSVRREDVVVAVFLTAAIDSAGTPTAAMTVTKQISLRDLANRVRVTGNSFGNRL